MDNFTSQKTKLKKTMYPTIPHKRLLNKYNTNSGEQRDAPIYIFQNSIRFILPIQLSSQEDLGKLKT